MASSSPSSSMATWLSATSQLGTVEMVSSGGAVGGLRVLASPQPKRLRHVGVGVVHSSMAASPQEASWLIRQGLKLRQLQSGLLAARSITPYYNCRSLGGVGVASISEVWSNLGGGGGKGFGGGGGGGGRGGGDGFGVPAAGDASLGTSGGDASNSVTEDVIFLTVGGMSCGGCSASVKRILEAQPQVKEATVDLATETATVQITAEPVAASGWEIVKRELGESLAKHLTSCGFKSSLKEDGDVIAPAA